MASATANLPGAFGGDKAKGEDFRPAFIEIQTGTNDELSPAFPLDPE